MYSTIILIIPQMFQIIVLAETFMKTPYSYLALWQLAPSTPLNLLVLKYGTAFHMTSKNYLFPSLNCVLKNFFYTSIIWINLHFFLFFYYLTPLGYYNTHIRIIYRNLIFTGIYIIMITDFVLLYFYILLYFFFSFFKFCHHVCPDWWSLLDLKTSGPFAAACCSI